MAHMLMTKDTMMSVRETPWHGLGAVLDEYPESIDDAIVKSGLGWKVRQGDVLVVERPEWTDDFGVVVPPVTKLAEGFRANMREDDGAVLGIVSDDYKVVQNEEAFKFLDSLIGSELYFETAGSLMNGKRVWVLVRLPEWVEVGGDDTAMFVYVANGHDGSMAVTSSATNVRIVCNNTLTWALRKSELGDAAARTYKFRHTGDLAVKFDEARNVMGLTLNYTKQFKILGDKLALEPFTVPQFEAVTSKLFPIDRDEMGKRAITNREKAQGTLLDIFRGKGPDGDTTGNSPRTKWCAVNSFAEYADWSRRYTKRTDQMQRSFEDGDLKQQALELVVAA